MVPEVRLLFVRHVANLARLVHLCNGRREYLSVLINSQSPLTNTKSHTKKAWR
jgi:hypothetical protein